MRDPYAVGEAMSQANENIRNLLFLGMRYRGVYLFPSPSQFGNVSTVMKEKDLYDIVNALSETLGEIKPFIAAECPNLLA